MSGSDPQPAGRLLLDVCPDPAVSGHVERCALAAGLTHRRADNAFAAAVHLLKQTEPPAVLLLALDALAPVELGVVAWAERRWPGLVCLGHGSPGRLARLDVARKIRLVRLDELASVLADAAKRPGTRDEGQGARDEGRSPSPQPAAEGPVGGELTAVAGGPGERLPADVPDEAVAATRETAAPPGASEESSDRLTVEPVCRPALRLRRNDEASAAALLTEEELATLLGSEEDCDG